MRLEMAILAGDESKKFLADLTKQLDRMEKLAPMMKGKKTVASSDDADEDAASEADEDDDEDFAAKPAKTKTAKAFDEDDDEEAEKPAGDVDEDEDDTADEDEDEEEKPAKKAKAAKVKKVTADDVNDACKKHAKANSREATLKILKKKFKVESVTELKPEQYEDVIKAVAVEE